MQELQDNIYKMTRFIIQMYIRSHNRLDTNDSNLKILSKQITDYFYIADTSILIRLRWTMQADMSGVQISNYWHYECIRKFRGFSPPANYTNRATAACRRSECQRYWIEGVAWSAQRIPTPVNFGFLDLSYYCPFK
jgi:hypothetical protein